MFALRYLKAVSLGESRGRGRCFVGKNLSEVYIH